MRTLLVCASYDKDKEGRGSIERDQCYELRLKGMKVEL